MARRLSLSISDLPSLLLALLIAGFGGALPATSDTPAQRMEPQGITGCYAARFGAQGLEVVDEEHSDVLLTPASVTKLVTAMAALELLGPDYRVRTELRTSRTPESRALAGDLVLLGAGDPTWSKRFSDSGAGTSPGTTPLESMARSVARRIDRVDGDLVLDASRFPGRDFPPSRAVSEIAYAYGAPTGALALDDNVAWLRIAPGAKVGDPARATWDGEAPYRIDNRTVTAPASRHEKGTFDVLPSWSGDVLVARGEYPISEPSYRLPVALHDGERRVGEALRRDLKAAGVELTGRVRLSESPVQAAHRLTAIDSPPVSEWLGEILGDSDNWLAEMLLRQIALHELGEGRTDDGAEHMVAELTKRAGLAEGALELEDGSGLSPYNLVTPRAVVELLLWGRTRPWWPVLAGALPASGHGTLTAWPRLPGATRAKTGTLRHTVALAGWVGTGPRTTYFACFVNHSTEERPVQRRRLAGRIAGY